MLHDLRYALRQIGKAPMFAAVAVITLALGIGANTAIFTLLDQALLRTLPVSHADELVRLRFTGATTGNVSYFGGDEHDYFSYPMYRDLRDKSTVFSGVLADDEASADIRWQNQPEMVQGEMVSGNYFDVLGIKPALGRLFVPADDAAQNGNPLVVLSFDYWKTRFQSDPGVIGKALTVNARPFTIVGVVQPGFRSVIGGYAPRVYFPLVTMPLLRPGGIDLNDAGSAWLPIVARLKADESRATAEAGINPLWHSLRAEYLAHAEDAQRLIRRGFQRDSKLLLLDNARGFSPLRDDIRIPLLIVMGMVGLVLLMACVNVSSLLLVRAAGRVREMALRYSLGATRWQIVRQLLAEGLLLGLLGGSVGLVLEPMVSSVLARRLVSDPGADLPFSTQPDHRMLFFNFVLALLVSLLFSLAPALRFLHPNLVDSLKQQSATASGGNLRVRRLSVAVQIGLSLLLLIGAGLFVQTLRNLRNVEVGFATDHLIGFAIHPQRAGYEPKQALALHQRILALLAAQPGVRAAAGTTDPELASNSTTSVMPAPGAAKDSADFINVEMAAITPGYFRTMELPLLAGRDFTNQDTADKPNIAIVNSRFARRFFGDRQSAVGQFLPNDDPKNNKPTQIVGVVGDARHLDLRTEAVDTIYEPFYQRKTPGYLQYYVRTWQPPDAAKATIRAAMQQLDANLVLHSLRTMDERIAETTSNERLVALLAVSFGVLASLMAAIGLYGVLAYATAQRTREIGIRMALGAQRQAVVRLVLADVLWLIAISTAVAVPIALLLARTLRSQLFGVSPADPWVMASGILLVALIVAVAALLPARRAAAIEPMQALRTE
jgi:predicted permease